MTIIHSDLMSGTGNEFRNYTHRGNKLKCVFKVFSFPVFVSTKHVDQNIPGAQVQALGSPAFIFSLKNENPKMLLA